MTRTKWTLGVVLLLLTSLLAYAGYLYVFKLEPMLTAIGTAKAVPAGASAKEKPLAILLLGVDSRPGSNSLNTDVIMTAAFNPVTKQASVVSIPRDTYMAGTKGLRSGKANAVFAQLHGLSRDKSNTQLKEAFGSLLQIPIDYVVTVDFQGFEELVDAVGGITIDVDMDMRYVDSEDGTNIHLTKGRQKLAGRQALDFVRYRKSNQGTAESNDIERNERQQQVIAAIVGKLKSPVGLFKLGGVFDAAKRNVSTDIPESQIKNMLTTYPGIDHDKIQYIHLDGEWRSPYIYLDRQGLEQARTQLKDVLQEP